MFQDFQYEPSLPAYGTCPLPNTLLSLSSFLVFSEFNCSNFPTGNVGSTCDVYDYEYAFQILDAFFPIAEATNVLGPDAEYIDYLCDVRGCICTDVSSHSSPFSHSSLTLFCENFV